MKSEHRVGGKKLELKPGMKEARTTQSARKSSVESRQATRSCPDASEVK